MQIYNMMLRDMISIKEMLGDIQSHMKILEWIEDD